ncbi:hypothetical protein RFI_00164 [Reticulomyxa filosa]|uniref:Uncharacterized protein n=1 Tax=Reticulomyxa filosa TaxID=46433 RepID=X6PEJ9_RETFI|nr:hypothetical protein RFI_00164 [Reticulomyxa filosa]|eukprot:ETO36900.1 hypothetical protein RFI_00164 [Reticulomyxa filosa]
MLRLKLVPASLQKSPLKEPRDSHDLHETDSRAKIRKRQDDRVKSLDRCIKKYVCQNVFSNPLYTAIFSLFQQLHRDQDKQLFQRMKQYAGSKIKDYGIDNLYLQVDKDESQPLQSLQQYLSENEEGYALWYDKINLANDEYQREDMIGYDTNCFVIPSSNQTTATLNGNDSRWSRKSSDNNSSVGSIAAGAITQGPVNWNDVSNLITIDSAHEDHRQPSAFDDKNTPIINVGDDILIFDEIESISDGCTTGMYVLKNK